MEESRAWIPADSPEFQLSRSSHCIFIAGGQSHVKRASEHMLAVFGYTKCRSCEHRIFAYRSRIDMEESRAWIPADPSREIQRRSWPDAAPQYFVVRNPHLWQ